MEPRKEKGSAIIQVHSLMGKSAVELTLSLRLARKHHVPVKYISVIDFVFSSS
jgi:hypothetical protein